MADTPQPSSRFGRRYFLRRSSAALIDYLIYFAFCTLYIYHFGSETGEGYQVQGCGHATVLLTVWIVCFPLPEAVFGRTLGKWGLDLRVLGIDGRRATAGQAFLRRAFDPIDLLPFFGIVAYIVAKTNAQHQRLGDLVAKTRVDSVRP